jgi:hypothetical protein
MMGLLKNFRKKSRLFVAVIRDECRHTGHRTLYLFQTQAHENSFGIGQAADEFSQGRGEFLDEGGSGDDILGFGERGMFVDVNHMQLVAGFNRLLTPSLEKDFCSTVLALDAPDGRSERGSIRRRNQTINRGTHDVFRNRAENFGEAVMAVENGSLQGQRRGPFIHCIHENAIKVLGPFEFKDIVAAGSGDNQGIDLSVPDRPERVFGFFQAPAQIGDFANMIPFRFL